MELAAEPPGAPVAELGEEDPLAKAPCVVRVGVLAAVLNQVSPPLVGEDALETPPAPIATYAVPLAVRPVTAVDAA
jgi:hypothetical protein